MVTVVNQPPNENDASSSAIVVILILVIAVLIFLFVIRSGAILRSHVTNRGIQNEPEGINVKIPDQINVDINNNTNPDH